MSKCELDQWVDEHYRLYVATDTPLSPNWDRVRDVRLMLKAGGGRDLKNSVCEQHYQAWVRKLREQP